MKYRMPSLIAAPMRHTDDERQSNNNPPITMKELRKYIHRITKDGEYDSSLPFHSTFSHHHYTSLLIFITLHIAHIPKLMINLEVGKIVKNLDSK